MVTFEQIKNRTEKIALIGLGYVGMPIAAAFCKKADVIGFDVNSEKVKLYQLGIDPTKEIGNAAIARCEVDFTWDETKLSQAKFHIVAVPTPVNKDHTPDLSLLESASHILGRNLSQGSVVVYESTVYPGATEEICVPILEKESGLVCGTDFKIAYSPERINPGDKDHRFETITKVVSAMDEESLDLVAKVYSLVVNAEVYRAPSIKVAEAAKVIENAQRDINIAFMNELSIVFHKMGIDTKEVLETAGTKWNFLKFVPGLVGGHCIGVDPYYLTYKAEQMGYHSQVILSGRRMNDGMGNYVAESLVKNLIKADIPLKGAKVAILGFTFKENCPDTRNTRVIDIVTELNEFGISPIITDPVANGVEVMREYGLLLSAMDEIKQMDAVVLAVPHKAFLNLTRENIDAMFKPVPNQNKVLMDVKGILDRENYLSAGYSYWRL